MKRKLLIFLLMTLSFALSAQSLNLLEGKDLKDREVETLDLGEAGKDKLKLGLSLGYPMTGLVAGWQAGKSMELDFLIGSWNYDSLCLGGGAMITIVNVEIGGELFPLTAGPFLYTGIGQDFFGLSAGGLVRMEYTFDMNLNLYLESGLMVNFFDQNDVHGVLAIPASLGIRYIF